MFDCGLPSEDGLRVLLNNMKKEKEKPQEDVEDSRSLMT